ncbi:hypothetical protein EDD85DRAFT_942347 [Armillaria nabsnona]|nr:hypothetical protein EDD85DRAFT_942347 [Armillaria nabsnona]
MMAGKVDSFFPAPFEWSNSLGNIQSSVYSLSSLITSISALDMLRHTIEGKKWTWKFWRDKWRFVWSSRGLHMIMKSVTSVHRAHQRLAQSAVKTTFEVLVQLGTLKPYIDEVCMGGRSRVHFEAYERTSMRALVKSLMFHRMRRDEVLEGMEWDVRPSENTSGSLAMLHRSQYKNDLKCDINTLTMDKTVGHTHKSYETDADKNQEDSMTFTMMVRPSHRTEIRNVTYQGHPKQDYNETTDKTTTSLRRNRAHITTLRASYRPQYRVYGGEGVYAAGGDEMVVVEEKEVSIGSPAAGQPVKYTWLDWLH